MPFSLRGLVQTQLRTRPDAVCAIEKHSVLTWSQLYDQATRVASGLVRDGVQPGARVLYLGKNGLPYFPFLFGCAMAGAVATAVNWRLTPRELLKIVDDSEAEVVFVDEEFSSVLEQIQQGLSRRLSAIVLDAGADPMASVRRWWGPAEDPGVAAPADIALQLYTSGTTGAPKGAMFSNGSNLQMLAEKIAPRWGLGPDDITLLCLPVFHMGGIAYVIATLAQGGQLVVVRDFEPKSVLETMERHRVTATFCVPAMLTALAMAMDVDSSRLELRRIMYAGAPMSTTALTHAMKVFRCDFVQIYGLTEATGAVAQLDPEDHESAGPRAALLRSAGMPYPWLELKVVAPEDGRTCSTGEIGEIWTRSEQNTVGYWRQPEQTSATIDADGWLRTGDLGRLDEEGRIFLIDRIKNLIISGGENVYPAEVENELAAHPAVAEVAVIGVPHERWGETVKAVVITKPGAEVSDQDLISWARHRLAKFKCPTSVDFVTEMPHTATGKIIKTELREAYWQGFERRIN